MVYSFLIIIISNPSPFQVPHKNGMIAEKIPEWLQTYVEKINNLGVLGDKKANHVLVNEYLSGQGIMPHTDGSLFHPIISTISCGSHTILELQRGRDEDGEEKGGGGGDEQNRVQILVERRSLLMIKDDAYHKYLHSIEERTEDVILPDISNIEMCEMTNDKNRVLQREKRISLTIRHVPKTSKMKLKFGT